MPGLSLRLDRGDSTENRTRDEGIGQSRRVERTVTLETTVGWIGRVSEGVMRFSGENALRCLVRSPAYVGFFATLRMTTTSREMTTRSPKRGVRSQKSD